MERALRFAGTLVRVKSVFGAKRADWGFVAQTEADRVAQIIETSVRIIKEQIPGISEGNDAEPVEEGQRNFIFHVKERVEVSSDGVTAGWIMQTEGALLETADTVRTAGKIS